MSLLSETAHSRLQPPANGGVQETEPGVYAGVVLFGPNRQLVVSEQEIRELQAIFADHLERMELLREAERAHRKRAQELEQEAREVTSLGPLPAPRSAEPAPTEPELGRPYVAESPVAAVRAPFTPHTPPGSHAEAGEAGPDPTLAARL
ncbi:hypothetical protein HNP84_007352 [Thermocatellispora tengchongensis]|uniref:Uncharacterized protein n=1 Tax=Thermocatellispora tengchongensis TaxID=1073253 RepID=A0A840PJ60_9ACTN|nr:hypothetical protein [Thermocatellispora tengchongensis]MBB5137600.1 hypothetical protein [Thermocatellispora tengchongensis]